MKKTIKIEGMHCSNCSSRTERMLGELEGVTATVDLERGEAYVECPEGFSDELLKSTVEDAGFEVTEIR